MKEGRHPTPFDLLHMTSPGDSLGMDLILEDPQIISLLHPRRLGHLKKTETTAAAIWKWWI